MSIFDNYFGKWIKVLDYQNNITIENYGYDTGIIEGTTKNHCVKCVAVNQYGKLKMNTPIGDCNNEAVR